VRVVDIKNGQVDVKDLHRTSRLIGQLYKRSTLKPGDLLLSIRGQVGKLSIVPNCLENANITQDTARLAPIESCSVEFLYGYLASNSIQQLISRNIKGMAVKGIIMLN
jgi:type I restriction enzyme, S subunit